MEHSYKNFPTFPNSNNLDYINHKNQLGLSSRPLNNFYETKLTPRNQLPQPCMSRLPAVPLCNRNSIHFKNNNYHLPREISSSIYAFQQNGRFINPQTYPGRYPAPNLPIYPGRESAIPIAQPKATLSQHPPNPYAYSMNINPLLTRDAPLRPYLSDQLINKNQPHSSHLETPRISYNYYNNSLSHTNQNIPKSSPGPLPNTLLNSNQNYQPKVSAISDNQIPPKLYPISSEILPNTLGISNNNLHINQNNHLSYTKLKSQIGDATNFRNHNIPDQQILNNNESYFKSTPNYPNIGVNFQDSHEYSNNTHLNMFSGRLAEFNNCYTNTNFEPCSPDSGISPSSTTDNRFSSEYSVDTNRFIPPTYVDGILPHSINKFKNNPISNFPNGSEQTTLSSQLIDFNNDCNGPAEISRMISELMTHPTRLNPMDVMFTTTRNSNDTLDYVVIEEGSFGKVYSGTVNDEKVAIKVPVEAMLHQDPVGVVDRILNEWKILSKCNHKNIVGLNGGVIHGLFDVWLVTKLIEGCDLHSLKYSENRSLCRKITPDMGLKMCRQLASVIKYLHSIVPGKNMIVHRDIKPENVIVDKDWNIHLCDFGDAEESLNGHVCRVSGATWFYAPIELLKCDPLNAAKQPNGRMLIPQFTEKWDIWSMGCVFHEMFGFPNPLHQYISASDSPDNIYVKLMHRAQADSLYPHIFPQIQGVARDIISRCLQPDPESRPSAEEIFNMWNTPDELILKDIYIDDQF